MENLITWLGVGIKDVFYFVSMIALAGWTVYRERRSRKDAISAKEIETQFNYDQLHLTDRDAFQRELRAEIAELKKDRDHERGLRRKLSKEVDEIGAKLREFSARELELARENESLKDSMKLIDDRLRRTILDYERELGKKDVAVKNLSKGYERQQKEIEKLRKAIETGETLEAQPNTEKK